MFGALNMRTGRFYWKSAPAGNAAAFIAFLHQLRAAHPGRTLYVILDNVSFHKCAKVKAFLARFPEVRLRFLPPYSPEHNPVEQVWKWLKTKVAMLRADSRGFADVVAACRRVLWHWRQERLPDPPRVGLGVWATLLI